MNNVDVLFTPLGCTFGVMPNSPTPTPLLKYQMGHISQQPEDTALSQTLFWPKALISNHYLGLAQAKVVQETMEPTDPYFDFAPSFDLMNF